MRAAVTAITITTMMTETALLRLLTWLSPAFPIGAFAYSHGIEWAVSAGDVLDEASLAAWVEDLLRSGSGRSDAILMRHAWRGEPADELNALALASQPGHERRHETSALGAAFTLAGQVWGGSDRCEPVAYPVAFGLLARANGVEEQPAALGLLHAFAANLISAAVRLIPLGQTAGLRVIRGLEPTVIAVAAETRHAGLDEVGGACFRSDIASMRHETQYTRLFRT